MTGTGATLAVFLLFSGIHGTHQDNDRPAPPNGTRAYAALHGPGLLRQEKWEEAARVYGHYTRDITMGVVEAWHSRSDRPQGERHRHRYHLLNFYCRHGDLTWFTPEAMDIIEEGARDYQRWLETLPPRERGEPLDFAHGDLLIRTRPRPRESLLEEEEAVLRAIEQNPESVPAILVYMRFLSAQISREPAHTPAFLEAAADRLVGPIGQATLGRYVERYSGDSLPDVLDRILDAAWQAVPSPGEKARLLFALARRRCRRVGDKTEGPRAEQALGTAIRVYERFPGTYQAGQAILLATSRIKVRDGLEAAMKEVDRARRIAGEQTDALADALYRLVGNHPDPAEKEAGLLRMTREYPEAYRTGWAAFELSRKCAEQGDKVGEIRWLEWILARDSVGKPGVSLLAEHYEKEGRWSDALRAWREVRLYGGICGNADMAVGSERLRKMIRCHRKMGDDPGLARTYVEILASRRSLETGDRLRVAVALFDLYREAGQLDDLVGIIDDIEKTVLVWIDERDLVNPEKVAWTKEYYRILFLRRLVAIQTDGELPPISQVVSLCAEGKQPDGGPGPEHWEPKGVREVAAEALACHGDDAVPAILEAIQEMPVTRNWATRRLPIRPAGRNRLIYALGRSRSPHALDVLEELARTAKPADHAALAHALAMKGQDGADVLQALASDAESPLAGLASEWCQAIREGEWVETPAREVRADSLPQKVAVSHH
jgi:hypothetical protein